MDIYDMKLKVLDEIESIYDNYDYNDGIAVFKEDLEKVAWEHYNYYMMLADLEKEKKNYLLSDQHRSIAIWVEKFFGLEVELDEDKKDA